jgi:hypothetical protein
MHHRVGSLGAGAATNANPGGWRNIFWIQAGFFALTVIGLLLFYHPKKESDFPRMSWKKVIWACDPIGSFLFIVATTLMLLALDWAGGVYPWHDKHVVAPLTIGLVSLVAFALYGELLTKVIACARLTIWQNGKAETMVLSLMCSSATGPIFRYRYSHLLLKAGYFTVPSIASLR